VISLGKIITSIVFLAKYSETCNKQNCLVFFYMMIIHDFVNVGYVFSYWIYSKFCLDHETMRNDYQNQLINRIDSQYEPNHQNNNRRDDLVETQCKGLGALKEINKM
jgi:hypothetical protein